MSVYIACDKCEKRLKIPENVVGRPIKCPSCGSVFKADPTKVMPGKPEPHPVIEERQPAAVAPRRAAPAADEDDDDVRPVRKPAALDDDDEDLPKPRKKAAALDDDEGIVTAKKKAVAAEDDEDEVRPARKKAAAVDDDDEDRPARRKKPAVDDDEDEDEEEDKAKKSKRRTPWYVMLPLLVLSLSGAGLAALWTIGFSYLDMDRGLAHLSNFDNKVWIGVSTAGVITLLCLIVTLIPARSWLRFLLVFLFLGIGYGGSFAAIHWWKDLPLPAEEKPADQPPPEGGPMGPPGGPPVGPRGGPPMGPPGGPPMGPPRGGRGPGGDAPAPPP